MRKDPTATLDYEGSAARLFAIGAHGAQMRKYTGVPYWYHCEEVAQLVHYAGGDPAMIAAAWLHDILEDTAITREVLYAIFGADVASLVAQVSGISAPADGDRQARKLRDQAHFAQASPRAKTIKLADIIANTRSIAHLDPEFAKVYIPEKKALLTVLTEGDLSLYAEARRIVTAWRAP